MPKEKSLRNSITFSKATQEEFLEICRTRGLTREVIAPIHSQGIITVKKEGKIIGYVQVTKRKNKDKRGEVTIERLAILPEYQDRGLGKKILGKINAMLLRKKQTTARLYGSNAAGFYMKTNYQPTGKGDEFRAALKRKTRKH